MKRILDSILGTSILAGILLGISFPPFNLFILSIPAFYLLIRLTEKGNSIRHVMYITFPGVLVWNIITTYWLTFATFTGGIAAVLANAVIMTVPLGLIYVIRKQALNKYLTALLTASSWITYEFLHYRWDLAWPWLTLGNSYANAILLIQYISITGVMGISFWIIVTSSLWYDWDRSESTFPRKLRMNIISLLIILIPIVFSVSKYFTQRHIPDSYIEVVVAQPNYDSYLPNSGYFDIHLALEELIELSDSLVTPNTKMIIWPENALIPDVHGKTNQYPSNRLREVAAQWNATLITGATWYRYYNENEKAEYPRFRSDGSRYNIFNAALSFSPDGTIQTYEKANLVPIVERFPFYGFFSKVPVPGVDWLQMMGYGRGNEIINFKSDEIMSPALICYDSVFPDWVRKSVLNGADFIAVITNDGWWGNTSGHVQHYDFARLRAVETNRSVIRSANNGISGMIYANGDIHSKTDYWERTALRLQVPVYSYLTVYVRYGDWIGYFSTMLIIILITYLVFIRLNGSKR